MNETLTAQLDGRGLPWVQAGDCLLVNADARRVLPLIPAASIDCVRSGRRCIAIEIDSDHFAKGVARVRDELARTRLIEPSAKITQSSLFEARS